MNMFPNIARNTSIKPGLSEWEYIDNQDHQMADAVYGYLIFRLYSEVFECHALLQGALPFF